MRHSVDTHSLHPGNQSAYRRGHATEISLLKVYSDLIGALDSNSDNLSVLAVLEMTAACDTVNHSMLLQQLDGVSGNALRWFISFLSDRHQSVWIQNSHRLVVLYCMAYFKGLF